MSCVRSTCFESRVPSLIKISQGVPGLCRIIHTHIPTLIFTLLRFIRQLTDVTTGSRSLRQLYGHNIIKPIINNVLCIQIITFPLSTHPWYLPHVREGAIYIIGRIYAKFVWTLFAVPQILSIFWHLMVFTQNARDPE